MGNIVLLDEHTVNKIAAGEVVDRPSSIVKELVENAIDAQATAITVEIKRGGISYIKITDNGVGFASDDVEMAFERHATSKIRKEEDLSKITSMGFRGEALASIAAISKVTLITRNKADEIGTKAVVEAGKILSIEPAASVIGTKIEIKDVFYNVPARFKFLKKDYTEAGYIEDVIIRIALSNPTISFKYINNGKVVVQTHGNATLQNTVYDIFGKEIYQNIIPISFEKEGTEMKVEGVIGLPNISRSTRMHQFTFINHRYIKDKTINAAIDRACQQKYAINKYAFLVINVTLNPATIDVNVHPAKLEVKFEDENKVFECVYTGIKLAIEENERKNSPFTNIKSVDTVDKLNEISKELVKEGILKNASDTKKYDFGMVSPISPSKSVSVDKTEEKEDNSFSNKSSELKEEVNTPYLTNEKIASVIDTVISSEVGEIGKKEEAGEVEKKELASFKYPVEQNSEEIQTESLLNNIVEQETFHHQEEILYRYIGQVFDTYIIIQIKDTMYIIDQHAAHERLLFEQIKKSYYEKDKQTQLLLLPIVLELTTKEYELVMQQVDMFEKSGFLLEEFGDNTVKISGVPNIGYDIDYKSMFKDLIDELLGASKTQNSEKEFRFIATLACKAAVKGNMKLTEEEQKNLIAEMVKLDNPFTCPHGRPTAYEITKYEIERRFLRK